MTTDSKDKRNFRRYRKKSNFKIDLNGKLFQAETIDYSFDGIGALIEDSPPITKGSVLDIHIKNPDIHIQGEVVWMRRAHSGTMVGIRNLDIPQSGRLKDYAFSDVLIGLQRSGKTGIFQIKVGTILKKIYIKNGDMVFAVSNQNEDRMGDMLLKEGKINIEQYNSSVEVLKKTGKRQGTVLVELGYIKPQELVLAVRHYVEQIIKSLFGIKDGAFEFIEGPLPSDEVITLKLSAANLIYDGIKRINDPQKIFDFLQLPPDAVLRFSSDPLNLFQDISLNDEDKKILSYIDGKTSIKGIISLSSLKDIDTLKTLYALFSTRIIEVKESSDVGDEVSADDVISEPEVKIDDEFVNRIEGIYKSYENIGYYGILGVKEWSPNSEIKKAYYRAAKEFHPDRHFQLKSETLKDKLNSIFSYITMAYTTLSDPVKRREYDNILSRKKKVVVSNEDAAKTKFQEGTTEFGRENYQEAFQLFGQAVYLDNKVADYHYYYGLSLLKLRRFKEAERAISRALEQSPFNADYITDLGSIYLHLGFPHRAKSNFEKAIKIDPSHRRAAAALKNIQDY